MLVFPCLVEGRSLCAMVKGSFPLTAGGRMDLNLQPWEFLPPETAAGPGCAAASGCQKTQSRSIGGVAGAVVLACPSAAVDTPPLMRLIMFLWVGSNLARHAFSRIEAGKPALDTRKRRLSAACAANGQPTGPVRMAGVGVVMRVREFRGGAMAEIDGTGFPQ